MNWPKEWPSPSRGAGRWRNSVAASPVPFLALLGLANKSHVQTIASVAATTACSGERTEAFVGLNNEAPVRLMESSPHGLIVLRPRTNKNSPDRRTKRKKMHS